MGDISQQHAARFIILLHIAIILAEHEIIVLQIVDVFLNGIRHFVDALRQLPYLITAHLALTAYRKVVL